MRSRLLLLVVLLLAPAASAGVLVVDAAGGGDFTTLTAAVAAAADGDTILVRNGTYVEPGLVVVDGKSLTIAGEPATSPFTVTATVRPGLLVRNLPAAKLVVLQNLRLIGADGTAVLAPTAGLVLRDNVSHVRVQTCALFGGDGASNSSADGSPALDAVDSASTAFVGCELNGGEGQFSPDLGVVSGNGGPGLVQSGNQILLYDSASRGGRGGGNLIGGWPQGGAGGAGIEHHAGVLFLAGATASGGSGGISHFGGAGGHGLSMGSSGVAWRMGGSSASGGQGGSSNVGPSGANGLALFDPNGIVTDFGGSKHRFDITSPVREGQVGTLRLGGDFTDTALVFLSPFLHQLPLSGYQGVLMLAPASMLGPFVLGPPGNVNVPFVVPELGAGIEALQVHVQAAYAGSDGVVLGPGRVLTVLDAAF